MIAFITLDTKEDWQKFIYGMLMGRSDDDHPRHEHAPNVDRTWMLAAWWIFVHGRSVKVRTRKTKNGNYNATNSGTFELNGRTIYFTYDHGDGRPASVVFRDGYSRGRVLLNINDQQTTVEQKELLKLLSPTQPSLPQAA